MRVRCDTCSKERSFSVARLAVKHGAEIGLKELLLVLTSRCKWQRLPGAREPRAYEARCLAYLPDLHPTLLPRRAEVPERPHSRVAPPGRYGFMEALPYSPFSVHACSPKGNILRELALVTDLELAWACHKAAAAAFPDDDVVLKQTTRLMASSQRSRDDRTAAEAASQASAAEPRDKEKAPPAGTERGEVGSQDETRADPG